MIRLNFQKTNGIRASLHLVPTVAGCGSLLRSSRRCRRRRHLVIAQRVVKPSFNRNHQLRTPQAVSYVSSKKGSAAQLQQAQAAALAAIFLRGLVQVLLVFLHMLEIANCLHDETLVRGNSHQKTPLPDPTIKYNWPFQGLPSLLLVSSHHQLDIYN